METPTLLVAIALVRECAYKNRHMEVPRFGGQELWNMLKSVIQQIDPQDKILADSWQVKVNEIEYKNIPEYDENKNMIEVNHFAIQMLRIPAQEKPTLRKILQVAFNQGQYEALRNTELDLIVQAHQLNNFDTYLDNDSVQSISEILTDKFIADLRQVANVSG